MDQTKKQRKKHLTIQAYVDGILTGNRTILSKAITLVESTLPSHIKKAQKIVEKCLHKTGSSVRIGITGVPGVGKSTFIESFGFYLTNDLGRKLAVLAIDPTSKISKGSILGDKVRMERLSREPNAYIRPSPTSGSLGGVARKTRETILLCEAAGFDTIIVETIGVGQSEITVHSMVDFFLLLLLAGAGDELQGIKRGIMEMADAIAITKADGTNKKKAELSKKEFEAALQLFPPTDSGWIPKVVTCSSLINEGISKIWEIIFEYYSKAEESGSLTKKRQKQAKYLMHETIGYMLEESFNRSEKIKSIIDEVEKDVIDGKTNSFAAAQKLFNIYVEQLKD